MKRLLLFLFALLALLPASARLFVGPDPDAVASEATLRPADSCSVRSADSDSLRLVLKTAVPASSVPSLYAGTVDRDSVGIDTLRRIDTVAGELVQLRQGDGQGRMLLEVGGFGLTFDRTYQSRAWERRSRFSLTALSDFEFGFTMLTGLDYRGYDPSTPDFLDQRLGPSFHFSFTPVAFTMHLGSRRRSTLSLGMQYTLENVRLADNALTLINDGRRIVPVALDTPADKSKIVYSSLGIVCRYTHDLAKHLVFKVALHADFPLGADAIYKHPKRKHTLSGLRDCQLGLGATLAYRGFGLYVRPTFTPLFKASSGIDCRTFSFGFSWSLNL